MTTTNRLAVALVAIGTASAVAAGVVTLATAGVAAPVAPASTRLNSTNAVGATDENGAGRHGGVQSVSHGGGVRLPASWPTAVPVPVGTITAKSTRPGVWLLMINEQATMSQARAKLIRLYKAHGFINKPQSTTLIVLTNHKYRVSALLAGHDHSATSTDMRLELDAIPRAPLRTLVGRSSPKQSASASQGLSNL